MDIQEYIRKRLSFDFHAGNHYQIVPTIDNKPIESIVEIYHFITTLLEKQREEIQNKLNKHWDRLESDDFNFRGIEDWRIYKCIRNNNNDVIKSHDKTS